MKVFKKIILLILVVGCAGSFAFGVDDSNQLTAIASINPLHVASFNGSIDTVRSLIEAVPANQRGAFIMASDMYGNSSLHYAAFNGHLDVVNLLLEMIPEAQRASFVMSKEKNGLSAFHMAVCQNHVIITKILLGEMSAEQKIESISTRFKTEYDSIRVFDHAVINNYFEIIKMLLDVIPVEQRVNFVSTKSRGNEGVSALFLAAARGHVAVVKAILESIPADQRINLDRRGLFAASSEGHADVVRIFIDSIPEKQRVSFVTTKESFVAASDGGGCLTPLDRAAVNGHDDVMKILLEVVSVEHKSILDQALYLACACDHVVVVNLLLRHYKLLGIAISQELCINAANNQHVTNFIPVQQQI